MLIINIANYVYLYTMYLSVDDRVVEHGGLVVDLLGHPPHVHVALGQPLRDEGALHAGLHAGLQGRKRNGEKEMLDFFLGFITHGSPTGV